MEDFRTSILEMCNGAFLEIADYEMSKIIDNILDCNTSPTAKRKLQITFEFKPDDKRQNVSVNYNAKSTLAQTNPMMTMLYVAGKNEIVEMVPQVPGQMNLDGEETDAAPTLRVLRAQ